MADFTEVFAELKGVLLPYAQNLECKTNNERELYLETRHIMNNKQPLFFGAVQIKKNYVSYYLMPVYVNPGLLDSASPELKKRMQGKSCFNFKSVDEALFKELAALTEAGFNDYMRRGYV